MSTNSVIAVPQGDGWTGRYCHSDGYPTHQVKTLLALVQRDGLEKVARTLTIEHAAWSFLQPDSDAASTDNYLDARGAVVPGYGLAYTTDKVEHLGNSTYQQTTDDEWITQDDGEDWYYVYVLAPHALIVILNGQHIAEIRYDATHSQGRLTEIECGAYFERCGHAAWYHFPDEFDGRRNSISVRVWLGYDAPSLHDASVVKYHGQHWRLTGSGSQGTAQSSRWQDAVDSRVRYWWASAEYGSARADLRVARLVKAGLKLEHDLVVSLRSSDVVLRAGSVISS